MDTSKERTAKWRAMITNFDKQQIREKDRVEKARKRAMMTEEEKERVREKDRIRKASKYVSLKKGKNPSIPYVKNEREHNRKYKEMKRQRQTEGEAEFERIDNLLIKRRTRAARSEEEKEADKKRAQEDMQLQKILPFKKRRPYGQREEYMWWQFWKKSFDNKELLRKKLPDFAKKFEEWDAKSENPFIVEEKEEERRLSMTAREKLDEKNRKRKLERETVLLELQKPIDMPEMEMCEYELLRERNIAERLQFMRESGLFDNLNDNALNR